MSIHEKIWPARSSTARMRDVRGRITALLSRLQPRERFFLLLLPRILARRYTASRVASYAFALIQHGNHRLGRWCWERAIRIAQDEEVCDRTVDLCVQSGNHASAVALANRYYDENGILLASAVRLTGALVLHDAFDAALQVYDRLIHECRGDLVGCWPAPAWSRPPCRDAIRSMLVKHRGGAVPQPTMTRELHLSMTKLCFSFGAFDVSAKLFERVGDHSPLDVEDSIAYAYSLFRSGWTGQFPGDFESIVMPLSAGPADGDWQILLATLLFASGGGDSAIAVVERAMRMRLAEHADVERIVADCRQIVMCIGRCQGTLRFDAKASDGSPPIDDQAGLRKIFVCGNGWSGSGALYDALTEYDGFAEAPETPVDRYVNPCTGNEMMLVQGAAGLGMIWRQAKRDGTLTRLDLWELFRCHVLGGGAFGFTEHKSAKTAFDLLGRMGARYTGMFRRLFELLSKLPAVAPLEKLRSYLTATTEDFAASLVGDRGDAWVVLNNTVFGSNIDMLEIFTNFRAAVVVRDPLDQFVDRRNQDLKHWMTARRFAPVYRAARESFCTRQLQLKPEHADNVREIGFERFVLDERYRQSTIDWLLEGRNVCRIRRRFEPERSARNIGIYRSMLSQQERLTMESELKAWRCS